MIETIFYVLIMALFASFSLGAAQYSYINRTFELLLRGAFETSIDTINETGDTYVHFNKELTEEKIKEYFETNLPRYVRSYEYSYYFTYKDVGGYCYLDDCDAIKISLKAEINGIFTYNKAKLFYIERGKNFE